MTLFGCFRKSEKILIKTNFKTNDKNILKSLHFHHQRINLILIS